MRDVAVKLIPIEKNISEEKGPFELFALFLREDGPDFWDLLVSAPWISKDKESAIRLIAGRITKALTKEELVKLSRIVIIERDNPALEAINRAIDVKGGMAEISNSNFFGMQIKHAYIITSVKEIRSPKENQSPQSGI